jgi:hypothetical protein
VKLNPCLVLAVLTAAGFGAVIHVPGDSATIQAGLNGAFAGDTVLVAPGVYSERLTWPAPDGISLVSEAGPDSTTIEPPGSGRVITMLAGSYTTATVLAGFTITKGIVAGATDGGAGIKCSGSPFIAHNRIVNNRLAEMGYGAGVYALGAPVMYDNLVAWDTIANAGGGGWRYGAGVYCAGSGVFWQNQFTENAGLGGAGGFWYGGGLFLAGGEPVVFGNLFLRNRMGTTTGGIAYGGGLYIESGSAYVANNTFYGNRCSTAIACGGGIYVAQSWTSVIKNNVISENVVEGLSYTGGGIACQLDTIHDTLTFDYNDVWANIPGNYNSCYAGPHALSSNPFFAAGPRGDFYLGHVAAGQDSNSPCIDAGDSLMMTSPLNLDSLAHAWTTRTDSVLDAGAVDIGYHCPVEGGTAVFENRGGPGLKPAVLTVRPNPARGEAGVSYELAATGTVTIRVFDALGREAARVLEGVQGPGRRTARLGRDLQAGTYLVELETGRSRICARLVVAE